ncbi:MAG: hypothetical protein WDW36_009492 [Sanguina aurantia]
MEASAAANLLAGHLQTLAKLLTQAVSILRAGTAGRACFVETSLYTWTADITSAFHTTKDFLSSVEHVSWADLDNAGKRGVAAAKRRLHIEHQLCLTASSSFLATCLRQLQCLDASTSSAADTYVPGRSSSDQGLVTAHEFRAFLAILQAVAVTAGWFALVVEDAVSPCLGRPPTLLPECAAVMSWLLSFLRSGDGRPALKALLQLGTAGEAEWHNCCSSILSLGLLHVSNISRLPAQQLSLALEALPPGLLSTLFCLTCEMSAPPGGPPLGHRATACNREMTRDTLASLRRIHRACHTAGTPPHPEVLGVAAVELVKLALVSCSTPEVLDTHQTLACMLSQPGGPEATAVGGAAAAPPGGTGSAGSAAHSAGHGGGVGSSGSGTFMEPRAVTSDLQLLAALHRAHGGGAEAGGCGRARTAHARLRGRLAALTASLSGVALGGVEVACVRGLVRCCSLRLMHRMQQQQQQQQQTPAGLEAVVGDDGMDQLQTLMLWLMEACTHSLDIDSDGSPLFYTQHQLWQLTHEQQRQLCQQRHTQSRGVLPALQWCKLHTWRGMAGSSAVLEAVLRFDPPGNNNTTNTSTTTTNNNNNNNSPLLLSALHSVSENLEMQTKRGQPSPPWQAHTSLAATLHKLLHQPLLDGVDATSLVAHLPMCVLYAMKIDFSLRSTLRAIDGYLRQNHTGGHDAAQPGQRHCAPIGEAAPNSRPIDGSASSCPPRHGTAVGGAAHTRAGGDEDQRGARQLFAVLAHSVVRLRIWRMRDTRARMSARTREESAAGLAEDLLGGDANLCEVVDVLQHLASDERHLQDDELATRGHARVWQRYALSHCHGRLLPGCGGPRCNNFAGVSEAALPTRLCGGCRRVRYCSVECQRAAWVEGAHREVCAVS